ncbi:MAG: hypothetical protein IJH63_00660 [Methanobrevibacter sp.]|nr:hypothetical protein [Methanobrevibacter sp.]
MNNIYEEFKKDFINPEVKVSVIKEKYDLSPSQYRDLKNRVLTDTGLTMKPSKCGYGNIVENKDKYIAYTKSAYVIYKTFEDGHRKSYGSYDSIETARFVRDKLVENNWDDELAVNLKNKYANSRCIPSFERAMNVYDDFEELYLNNCTRKEITSNLGISFYQYNYLAGIVREKHNLPLKRGRRKI